MLTRLILSALCATAAVAQTLDTVVRFPYEVRELFHMPGGNKLYVTAPVRDSGTDHIYILDCATMAVRRVIPAGTLSVYAGDHRAAWCPQNDRVYMGFSDGSLTDTGVVAVVDNAADSVLLRMPVGTSSRAIVYNPVWDKVYSAAMLPLPSVITSIDCAADTVLRTIALADYRAGGFAVWDSTGDRVYFGGGGWTHAGWMAVLDCRTDSVVAVIHSGISVPCVAAHNPLRRKLYVGGEAGFGVAVIDCATDSVTTRFDSIWSQDDYLPAYCSVEDKVYWPVASNTVNKPDTINVIDCATDSVIRRFSAPNHLYCAYAPWSNRLYVASQAYPPLSNLLTVYDCRNDSVIGQTRFGVSAREIVCNPIDHRIYVSDFSDSAVYVFREDLQPVAEEPERGSYQLQDVRVWPNPAHDWLYVSGTEPLAIYSAGGRRLLALAPGRNRLPRNFPAGVYFVRTAQAQAQAQAVRKVVVTR
jgi:DNA-binding beta-propeller fold protein YncE